MPRTILSCRRGRCAATRSAPRRTDRGRNRVPEATVPGTSPASIPALLRRNADRLGARPAYREKEFGIWQEWSWAEALAETEALALGLLALGLAPGEHVAIIGRNRPALYWSMVASQMCGAIPVPVYQDAAAEEVAYVMDHCGARLVIAGDQEQVDKVIEAQAGPGIDRILYLDARGLRNYDHARLGALAELAASGRARRDELRPILRQREAALTPALDLRDALYLRDHRPAQGGGPVEPQHHRDRARLGRVRPLARDRRGAGLSADGLGRRFHLLDRAGDVGRVLRQLPRERRHDADRPARDRADLFLRPAPGVREPADAGDDPDGGCLAPEKAAVRLGDRGRASGRAGAARRAAGLGLPTGCATGSARRWSTAR